MSSEYTGIIGAGTADDGNAQFEAPNGTVGDGDLLIGILTWSHCVKSKYLLTTMP